MDIKNLAIEEDKNKLISFATHQKKMMDEIFNHESTDLRFKRYIPMSYSIRCKDGILRAGTAGWVSFDFAVLEILWVEKTLQGKGIGTKLLNEFESFAKKNSCTYLLASTNSFSNSIVFWEKNHFKTIAQNSQKDIFYMEKTLVD